MERYIELIEPFDQNGYTPNSVMASSPNGDWVLYSEAQAEIDALKAQRDALLAVAQNVVDAHAPTTHAIIAPTLEAFSRAVSDRQNHRDAAIYQLRQAIAKTGEKS